MVTQKRCIIPIFDYKLSIYIFDKWKELEHYLPKEEFEQEANAIVFHTNGQSSVFINSTREMSITHESVHIKNAIWRFIGYTPQRDNDEIDAYLIAYIYYKILEVYKKHNT